MNTTNINNISSDDQQDNYQHDSTITTNNEPASMALNSNNDDDIFIDSHSSTSRNNSINNISSKSLNNNNNNNKVEEEEEESSYVHPVSSHDEMRLNNNNSMDDDDEYVPKLTEASTLAPLLGYNDDNNHPPPNDDDDVELGSISSSNPRPSTGSSTGGNTAGFNAYTALHKPFKRPSNDGPSGSIKELTPDDVDTRDKITEERKSSSSGGGGDNEQQPPHPAMDFDDLFDDDDSQDDAVRDEMADALPEVRKRIRPRTTKQKLINVAIVTFVVLGIGVGIAVAVFFSLVANKGPEGGVSSETTASVSLVPSSSPTTALPSVNPSTSAPTVSAQLITRRNDALIGLRNGLTGHDLPLDIWTLKEKVESENGVSSVEWRAAYWLLFEDEMAVGHLEKWFWERFGLAVIYYATSMEMDDDDDAAGGNTTYLDENDTLSVAYKSNTSNNISRRLSITDIFEDEYPPRSHRALTLDHAPTWIHSTHWLTSTPVCSWYGISCDSSNTTILSLNLDVNNLTGSFPPHIYFLPTLKELRLRMNALRRQPPWEALEGLTQLETLDLRGNDFTGALGDGLWRMNKLSSLYVSYNNFDGTLPGTVVNISNLEIFYFNENEITGDIPYSFCSDISFTADCLANTTLRCSCCRPTDPYCY